MGSLFCNIFISLAAEIWIAVGILVGWLVIPPVVALIIWGIKKIKKNFKRKEDKETC